MRRDEKAAVIEDVVARIEESEAIFAVDYRGMSVAQAAELRTRLRDADARFSVVKNTLTERAADQAGAEGLKPMLEGPTAMTFVKGDAALAAKTLSDFRRSTGGLVVFKGGWMNGSALTPEQVDEIAKLPSREVLYGRLVGMVASPLTGLAGALGGLIGGLARQLQAISDQGLVGGSAAPSSPAAEAPAEADGVAAPGDGAGEETAAPASEDPDAGPASQPDAGPHPDPAPGDEPAPS
ncbi:MAG: LSU ribosomal protein L10p (P0) [uncultured Solirubrobacteraceae bacterium]|uniref:Large ribosomal subunit protein uL10 n=1 Tax=uncultured Solirubrobacteraceae bacterium TaxID=1162706 RepID=A0A6J4R7P7_9ACTN|nr:MAG: LSU ribosomal protein L10p (P0) [uncultured Solirubrobacteraceae bacterium]